MDYGFYIVITKYGDKTIAKCYGSYWCLIGYDGSVDADYFTEILEKIDI